MNQLVSLIGAPTDIGAGARGSSMGPEALRVADIGPVLVRHGLDETSLTAAGGPLEDQCQALAVRRLEDGLFAANRCVVGPHLLRHLWGRAVPVGNSGLVGHSFPSAITLIGA